MGKPCISFVLPSVLIPLRLSRPPPAPSLKGHHIADVVTVYLAMTRHLTRLAGTDVSAAVTAAPLSVRHRPALRPSSLHRMGNNDSGSVLSIPLP